MVRKSMFDCHESSGGAEIGLFYGVCCLLQNTYKIHIWTIYKSDLKKYWKSEMNKYRNISRGQRSVFYGIFAVCSTMLCYVMVLLVLVGFWRNFGNHNGDGESYESYLFGQKKQSRGKEGKFKSFEPRRDIFFFSKIFSKSF